MQEFLERLRATRDHFYWGLHKASPSSTVANLIMGKPKAVSPYANVKCNGWDVFDPIEAVCLLAKGNAIPASSIEPEDLHLIGLTWDASRDVMYVSGSPSGTRPSVTRQQILEAVGLL